MGGSMGSVAGEKIVLAVDEAIKHRLPVVFITASGGARMQEGLVSLMQMAKTSAAVAQPAKANLPYIVVLTDPTTAGVMASYASLGDVLIAEPHALIAFTGDRVAAQAAQGDKAPTGYQSAEWRLAIGHIDMIVNRRELPGAIGKLLSLFSLSHAPAELSA
jgi:acetyl-CoA carboxylase carboxyl transferase subunit beta